MDFYIDESGNTGDLARTGPTLDFGGQAVFSLAAVGLEDEESLTEELAALRRRHNVQATELKLSKILKRKPAFALDAVELLVKNDFPFFVEIVDKKYLLAVSITNGFIWPPYFNTEESQKTVWLKNIFADYLYHQLSNEVFFAFVQCMNSPSNENTAAYFDLLKEFVSQGSHDVAKCIVSQVDESKDDFRIMIEREGDRAHRRFLPIPDIGKREQEVWLLPNYSSFTNIYARMNLFISGKLQGTRIFHDEQMHFDEIIAAAKSQAEKASISFSKFKPPYSNYNFKQISDLFFKASPESTGVQLADIVAGLCMRWYQAHLKNEDDTDVLDRPADVLLHHVNPDRGVGINVVGPHHMAEKLFGVGGY
ncbi:DUF3800 domain-containing protein [Achromobacter sp. 2789STDY5608621]|uniref:DUF3800 domain-containing protein n=1 Tax=Achromobacter sp. 2789STDY5608621 TaxID=1806496 RepID=UPI0006C385D8|nr:DUF3800 domain-containing protein [Achromobacter sp. 2789STDY5608621]CUJ37616.1 Protein of uncharacterised function (DUF3800) [Achromobacter sp. 2789STDY5608621]